MTIGTRYSIGHSDPRSVGVDTKWLAPFLASSQPHQAEPVIGHLEDHFSGRREVSTSGVGTHKTYGARQNQIEPVGAGASEVALWKHFFDAQEPQYASASTELVVDLRDSQDGALGRSSEADETYQTMVRTRLRVPDSRPTVIEQDQGRKRAWGLATTHRVQVVVLMIVSVALLFGLQNWIWADNSQPTHWYGQVWSWSSVIWITALIPAGLGLLGMLWYRPPEGLDEVEPVDNLVVWRIVSRGQNVEVLESTVRRCHTEMAKTPLFPYLVEVITDHPTNDLNFTDKTNHLVVPAEYRTDKGSLYKARALQYGVENSAVPDDAWLVHLDEETQPTASGIRGIARMIAQEEESGRLRIGQGAILYHRTWRKHPFLTLADMVRTGDDFARFYFQHRIGITLFGLHGSYIVCRNDVEKEIGFDFGPEGSITEDAFWALKAMEAGRRARWCDGYLEEQSTQSVLDFLRQRRRWWQGLVLVSLYAPVKIRFRAMLGLNTVLWAMAPLSLLYTYVHFFLGYDVRPWIQWGANIALAAFIVLYITGLRANLLAHGISNPIKKAGWYTLQVLLLPVFSLMEAIGVAYAVVRPSAGFHVVKK